MISKKMVWWMCSVLVAVSVACTYVLTSLYGDMSWVRNSDQMLVDQAALALIEDYGRLQEIKKILQDEYYFYDEQTAVELVEGALKGAIDNLSDQYAQYFSPESFEDYNNQSAGRYDGIGAAVDYDAVSGYYFIAEVYANSPAAKAGLLVGDQLVKAAQMVDATEHGEWTDLYQAEYSALIEQLEGESGTRVYVAVRRAGVEDLVERTIERAEVTIAQAEWRMLPNKIGYIKLKAFGGNAEELFVAGVDELVDQQMTGLIIDLRNNGGGQLNILLGIADRLLGKGVVMESRPRVGKAEKHKSTDDNSPMDITRLDPQVPVVLLINGNTASAAEVLACAVVEIGGGVTVGTRSYGKGVMQSFKTFPDGASLKYTSDQWFTQSGQTIQGEGIAPTYTVELPAEIANKPYAWDAQNDTQLQKAMAVINEKK